MKTNYLYLILLISFFSCKDNILNDTINNTKNDLVKIELTPDEYISIAYDQTGEINENEISEIIKESKIINNGKSTRSLTSKVIIKDKYFIGFDGKKQEQNLKTRSGSNDISIPIYEIEYGKSKLLISADKRASKILAYIPNNIEYPPTHPYYFYYKNIKPNKDILELSQLALIDEINRIEHIKDSLRHKTLEKISNQLSTPIEKINFEKIKNGIVIKIHESTTRTMGLEDPPGEHQAQVYPLLETKWGIGVPYSLRAQNPGYIISPTSTAIAQMMAYYEIDPKKINTQRQIDWSYLKENPQIKAQHPYYKDNVVEDPEPRIAMVSQLCGIIDGAIGTEVEAVVRTEPCYYYYFIPKPVRMTKVRNVLDQYFHSKYRCNTGTRWNIQTIKSHLYDLKPIICFSATYLKRRKYALIYNIVQPMICDGFIQNEPKISGQPGDLYLHMNFCSNWDYNGYYLVKSTNSIDYHTINFKDVDGIADSRSFVMITDLEPK